MEFHDIIFDTQLFSIGKTATKTKKTYIQAQIRRI